MMNKSKLYSAFLVIITVFLFSKAYTAEVSGNLKTDTVAAFSKVAQPDSDLVSRHTIQCSDEVIKNDVFGLGMIVISMGIIFTVVILLILVSWYISTYNSSKGKKKSLLKKGKIDEAAKISEDAPGEVYAAIAMALHLYQSRSHDDENTVITIEKVARTYSPWSSKIYGLRQYHKN